MLINGNFNPVFKYLKQTPFKYSLIVLSFIMQCVKTVCDVKINTFIISLSMKNVLKLLIPALYVERVCSLRALSQI